MRNRLDGIVKGLLLIAIANCIDSRVVGQATRPQDQGYPPQKQANPQQNQAQRPANPPQNQPQRPVNPPQKQAPNQANQQQINAQNARAQVQAFNQARAVPVTKVKDARVRSQKPAMIEVSAPIANLFARAEEGMNRQDWKLAIDSLQRIIDDPEGSLIVTSAGAMPGGRLYEFTRRQAVSRLAEMPPVAQESYRILYDGTAKGMFERAKSGGDSRGLRDIVTRYPLTSYGDDAAELLATWALEEGHATDAASLLQDIRFWMHDSDVASERVLGKLAIAYSMLGMGDQAEVVLKDLEAQLSDVEGKAPWFEELRKIVLQPSEVGLPQMAAATTKQRLDGGTVGALKPTILASLPWVFLQRPNEGTVWRAPGSLDFAATVKFPAFDVSADEDVLVVRTGDGFAGLSGRDLSVLWSWPAKESAAATEGERLRITRAILGADGPVSTMFEEGRFAGESVAIAHGMAMLVTLDEAADGRATGGNPLLVQVVQQGQRPSTDNPEFVRPAATRLVACELRTGEVRWVRMVGLDEQSGDLPVEIRGRPIEVGEHLWVAALRQSQLFFAVVDPKTGLTIREISLCDVDLGLRLYRTPITPVVHDGIVYLSTDEGMVVAVDAATYSLRWAASYPRGSGGGTGQWLPVPPTVTGGLLVVAPNDCDDLMAFSTVDGQFRWSIQTQEQSYFLGADRHHAWYVGKDVRCVSTKDGHEVWVATLADRLTGLPVMRDGLVYAPVAETLVTIDAGSGTTVTTQAVPTAVGSLGNLYAGEMGIYTVDPKAVRFFPDMERSYTGAIEGFESDRGNPSRAIHLARLEVLRGRAERALDILDAAMVESSADGSVKNSTSAKSRIANARTEALLAMANRSEVDETKITDWLRRAVNESTTIGAKLQATVALAKRLEAQNRFAESYQTLWEIGTTDERVPLQDGIDGARIAFSAEMSQQLQRVRSRMSVAESEALDSETLGVVSALRGDLADDAKRPRALRRLNAIVELQGKSAAFYEAQLVLAQWEWNRNQRERADLRLRELANGKYTHQATAEQSQRIRNLIRQRIAEELQTFPASPGMAERRESIAAEATVDWAEFFRPGPSQQLGGRVLDNLMLDDTGVERRVIPNGRMPDARRRLVTVDAEQGDVFNDLVLLMGSEEAVDAVNPHTLDVLWSAPLRLPNEFRAVAMKTQQVASDRYRFRACVDGQIGVFQNRKGIFAVGLLTGKRLWAIESDGSTFADQAMAASNGLAAISRNAGSLQVVRTIDGSTVWERDLSSDPIKKVWIHGDRVVIADGNLERVHLFSLADGRMISQVGFRQADPRSRFTRLVISEGVLCGPDSTQQSGAVFAVDVADGRPLWRTEMGKGVSQLFVPSPGEVGIGTTGGDVRIVKLRSGAAVADYHIPEAYTVFDGIRIQDVLVVEHGAPPSPMSRHWSAFFSGSDQRFWVRSDLAPLGRWNERLAVVDGRLATVFEGADPRAQAVRVLRMGLVDPFTGQDVGPQVDLPASKSVHQQVTLTGDVGFWNDLVVVGANDGLILISTAAEEVKEGSDSK